MFSDVESFSSEVPSAKKTNKPLMEKKRRARINRCLSELKEILIKDNHVSASHAKWEKADILEMTVDYVKKLRSGQDYQEVNLKRRAPSVESSEDTTVLSKSPASVCSPPSTSSTEFSEAPEAKRKRRSDPELGQPHAPIPTYGGISQQYLAQQILLAQLQHHTNMKMAAVAPMLPLSSFPSAITPTVLGATPWR